MKSFRHIIISILWTSCVMYSACLHAQAKGNIALIVKSPENGILVSPGETIIFNLVTNNVLVTQILIIPEALFPAPPPEKGRLSFASKITIPKNISAGVIRFTAVGFDEVGRKIAESDRFHVLVGAKSIRNAIQIVPSGLRFKYPGRMSRVSVTAELPDGSPIDVTEDPRLSLRSDNANIVSTSYSGFVTAVSSGSTSISALFTISPGLTYEAKIPVLVDGIQIRGDLNGDGKVDMDDINIVRTELNRMSRGLHDAVDINRDGKIDALDLRILTTLCTFPRCALHP